MQNTAFRPHPWLSVALVTALTGTSSLTVRAEEKGAGAAAAPSAATTLVDEAISVLEKTATPRTAAQTAHWQAEVARARTAVKDAKGDLGVVATTVATLAGPAGRAYARWSSPVDQTLGWLAPAVKAATPPHAGMLLARRGAKWFAVEIFPGSPAANAGLLRGDEVLADGSLTPQQLLAAGAGADVRLKRRRFAGETPVELTLKPTTESWTSLVAADLARAPTLLNSGKHRVAVLKWPELTEESLRAPALAALGRARDQGRAVVLDLRGERGIGGVTWLEPFLGTPGDAQAPAGAPSPGEAGAEGPNAQGAHWALHIAQPMVAVVDGSTHGGRELLARVLARSGRARLVGRETAGRVAPETVHALSSGAVLVVAAPAPVGLDLRPIAPDEEVEDGVAYTAGRDPLLEHAVRVAVAAVDASLAAKAAPKAGH